MLLLLIEKDTGNIEQSKVIPFATETECVQKLADVDQHVVDGGRYVRAFCITPAGQKT